MNPTNQDKLSPAAAQQMIRLLKAAGHGDLATTLRRHIDGRQRGETPTDLAQLWLE